MGMLAERQELHKIVLELQHMLNSEIQLNILLRGVQRALVDKSDNCETALANLLEWVKESEREVEEELDSSMHEARVHKLIMETAKEVLNHLGSFLNVLDEECILLKDTIHMAEECKLKCKDELIATLKSIDTSACERIYELIDAGKSKLQEIEQRLF